MPTTVIQALGKRQAPGLELEHSAPSRRVCNMILLVSGVCYSYDRSKD